MLSVVVQRGLTQPLQGLLLREDTLLLALLQGGRKQASICPFASNQLCHLLIALDTHRLHDNHNRHSIPAPGFMALTTLEPNNQPGSSASV